MNQFLPPPHLEDDYCPNLVDGALVRSIGTEAVGWAPSRPSPVYLDNIAALLTGIFDGGATSAEIVSDLREAIGVETGLAKAQLERVLMLLATNGMLKLPTAGDQPFVVTRNLLPEPNW